MLLQTLRARVPRTLFFTTELDARLVDAQNSAITRNLIVASHFDEALAPPIQRYIIPFRDSNQTALFLSTSLAVLDAYVADARNLSYSIGQWNALKPRCSSRSVCRRRIRSTNSRAPTPARCSTAPKRPTTCSNASTCIRRACRRRTAR